jgi:ABC-type transport system involved in multi-copper enzyme maturation permease subunit
MTSPALALLRRETVAALRGTGAFAMLLVAVGLCVGGTIFLWPEDDAPRAVAAQGVQSLYQFLLLIHLGVATVLPPGLAALAFAEDRRQDTLDQLRLSLVTTGGLVGAKLLAAVTVFALLFVASLPCAAVLLMGLGISSDQTFVFIALPLASILMSAAIGIFCAVYFRRPSTALIMSYVGTGFVLGGWMVLFATFIAILAGLFSHGDYEVMWRHLPGFITSGAVDLIEWGPKVFDHVIAGNLSVHAAWCAVAFRVVVACLCIEAAIRASMRLTTPAAPRRRKLIDDPETLRVRRRRFPFYLIDPLHRKPPIPDSANPVFIREWRRSVSGRSRLTIPAFVLTAVALTMIYTGFTWVFTGSSGTGAVRTSEEFIRIVLSFLIPVLLLLVQVLSAGAFAREREQQGADFLRSSLLSSHTVFWGQFWGGAAAAAPFLGGTLLAFLVAFAVLPWGLGSFPMLFAGFATTVTCVWFTLCLACFISGYAKSTAAAIAAGVITNLFIYLWPFIGIFWCESARRTHYIRNFELAFEHFSPPIAFSAHRWFQYWPPGTSARNELSVERGLYVTLLAFAALGLLLVLHAKTRFQQSTHARR